MEGHVAFEETGVILSIIEPISSQGLEVFVISTYNGDLFLFKEEQFAEVIKLLKVMPDITLTAYGINGIINAQINYILTIIYLKC